MGNDSFDGNTKYDFVCGGGGSGSRSARSGRQRAGATGGTRTTPNRGFTSIDSRRRTNVVQAARVLVGGRTQRSRVRG